MDEDVLVIADHSKVLGLAGVMGGNHSGIGPTTSAVLLEVAWFDPAVAAGRGRRYGLVTDASQRFERGVDPTGQERALERATALLLEFAGGVAGPRRSTRWSHDVWHRPPCRSVPSARVASSRPHRHSRCSGSCARSACTSMHARPRGWSHLRVAIRHCDRRRPDRGSRADPRFRNVPETPLAIRSVMRPATEQRVPIERLADTLADRGYYEAVTYSFVDPAVQRLFDPDEEGQLSSVIRSRPTSP